LRKIRELKDRIVKQHFSVVEPTSLPELFDLLADSDGEARLIAGGTALTIMIGQGLVLPDVVVNLQRVHGLDYVKRQDHETRIGPLVTLRRVERDPAVRRHVPALASVLADVANVRVRNVATIGGNICEADYASDPPTLLVALDGAVRLASAEGERVVALTEFFRAFYETVIEPNEVLTELIVPDLPPHSRATYVRHVSRSAEDRPCVGVAASVTIDPETKTCRRLRVSVGAVAETPQRLTHLELQGEGNLLTERIVAELAHAYGSEIEPLDDIRGSAWYRREMIEVFVRRAILACTDAEPARTDG
jgi:carbon-monoxide dehydrogenase medium subunit